MHAGTHGTANPISKAVEAKAKGIQNATSRLASQNSSVGDRQQGSRESAAEQHAQATRANAMPGPSAHGEDAPGLATSKASVCQKYEAPAHKRSPPPPPPKSILWLSSTSQCTILLLVQPQGPGSGWGRLGCGLATWLHLRQGPERAMRRERLAQRYAAPPDDLGLAPSSVFNLSLVSSVRAFYLTTTSMRSPSVLLGLLGLAGHALADPTWPSAIDELEEIMYQLSSFRARKFADTVSPCTNEASGPGRQNAAEWLRTAFHDMATANTFFHTGGLDASLQYELDNGENTGPGHKTTLQFMAPFMSPRSSLSDLIALGVYTSVRSCGGPAVPFRAGRKDATEKGNTGVPQPQNSVSTFQLQFERMGFTNEEMIQVTACGHTIGGVHKEEFPDLMPPGDNKTTEAPLDSTVAVFDNEVVTEYLSGNTTNPLVVGPAVKINKNSDFKVFNSDGNKTMTALANEAKFQDVCKVVLQKMIDVVPPDVTLSDPVVPYMVKPVNLQLTLADGGDTLSFTGFIRVKTTGLAKDSIKSVSVTYKGRMGATDCGSGSCTMTSTVQGVSQGFDDTFAFYPIQATISAASGISSFTVTVNNADGTSKVYDNNGKAYPLQDDILFQAPQSCVTGNNGAVTLVAAVRNDVASKGAKATIWFKSPQTKSPLPQLKNSTIDLKKGACVGKYTLFSSDYSVEGGMVYQSYVDVTASIQTDGFKSLTGIGGTCKAFDNPAPCDGVDPPVSTSTASTTGPTVPPVTSTTTQGVNTTATVTTSTTGPTATLHHRDIVGGYKMVSCWTEGDNTRALDGISFANDTMTLEKCMAYCSAYVYWGTEYGRECYCGNALAKSSEAAPLAECNMACGGDASEYCGAGNRIELYSTTSAPVTPTPTGTLIHKPTVSPYTLVGCWTEGSGARALEQKATTAPNMTNDACGAFCKDYKYFGTEYGAECYCGSYLTESSQTAPFADCNMPCGGDRFQYCGASDRLELYMNPNATGGNPEQPAAVGDYVLAGCQTEGNGTRALPDKATAADAMTNTQCAAFCKGYKYFGTEYGRECYCGNKLDASSTVAPQKECRMLCGGSALEYCGASDRLSVYKKKETAPPQAATPAEARRRNRA
ncbi:putative fungistatic metabolite [Tolypocladium ophioglossoides CBS 100239]|uniref:Putative fungistatic metabolite n=1 Tax=Tolypocladium ophioglossoides (strain CBS 100239) TaxID=1163406 RepID=A0A0L0NII1_TOLOC|nr:putative fungistatic metabolite [Tolypocladium ophioglossoides CBS 100239]